ncbi:potassium-transporting ATPase subunit KdpC [Paraburkholderia humisilvae]|uniref:Potassium-transporting ATPase KdpC subunit n=1 Tax=Paraburkholderia humisilvae TaxID=627669 RepID=A0A6J5DEI9_9BURK|nr:potassium-transporting ATPase subunit KdpC [Paraburkholderia humisilvae]CAB3751226.1 Potassium-transporting ATPase KdpC subunit [Paraburkholderia humisilvae]
MKFYLRPALILLVLLTVLTGVVYPLIVTAVAQAAFPGQANGSLLEKNGKAVGSALIGQQFDAPRYFWGRLSATTPNPYNAQGSTGSNLGPTNPALADEVKGRIAALRGADPSNQMPIPVDLVTSSGSGLDPDISPAAAAWQTARVARARGLTLDAVNGLIAQHTSGRQLGVFGERRVNVLQLNLALDEVKPMQ